MILEVFIKDVVSGVTETRSFGKSPVRIGRNQLNDIPLDDPFVSEWHGIIRFDGDGVAYFDMGSTNGTIVDGGRIQKNIPSPLSRESRIVLGRRELSVTPPERAAAPAPAADEGIHKTIGWGEPIPALRPAVAQPLQVSSGRRAAFAPGAPIAEARPADARVAQILAAFCEAFVGLRKGFQQFGAEVGVRTINGASPLYRARSREELMGYLLDPTNSAEAVTNELIGVFADLGIHHIAMMEGITEGVRSLLQSLDPRAFELDGGGGGLFSGAKKAKGRWNAYVEHLDQLVTDDEQLHTSIFGDEFARAYASVTLGGPRAQGNDGDDGDGGDAE